MHPYSIIESGYALWMSKKHCERFYQFHVYLEMESLFNSFLVGLYYRFDIPTLWNDTFSCLGKYRLFSLSTLMLDFAVGSFY